MDRPHLVNQGLVKTYIRTPQAPHKTPIIKMLADLFMCLMFGVLALLYVARLGSFSGWDSMDLFAKIYMLGISTGVLFGIRYSWRSAQANGFSAGKSLVIFLLQCSVVLFPIAWALGSKRGFTATCDKCRQYKFVWARQCPQCAHANQGTILFFWGSLPWKKDKTQQQTPLGQRKIAGRTVYRVVLPMYLIIFTVFICDGVFQNEKFTLLLNKEGVVASERTSLEIREYLTAQEDVEAWLNQAGEKPLLLPSRFRIEVRHLGVQVIEVHCYSLRWEESEGVAERIITRIMDEFPDAPITTNISAYRSPQARAEVNRFELSTFLDGEIHWKERKK